MRSAFLHLRCLMMRDDASSDHRSTPQCEEHTEYRNRKFEFFIFPALKRLKFKFALIFCVINVQFTSPLY